MKNTRILLSILLLYCMHNASAQKLYYFIDAKDSLIGVKDNAGKIVIPPIGNSIYNVDFDTPITDSLIFIPDFSFADTSTCTSFGAVYNRRGKFLYRPMMFDNGPDYQLEGRIRFVENKKVGFVNEWGRLVLPAQWDWASPFNYGYIHACNDCYFDRNKDAEHPPLVLKPGTGFTYINRNGDTIIPMKIRSSEKDFKTRDGYLPYAFSYTAAEQKILDKFNKLEVISKIRNANYAHKPTGKEALIQFEIISKPTPTFAYYKIQGYRYGDFWLEDEFTFLYSEKGDIFHIDENSHEKLHFNKWLKQQLEACIQYFENDKKAPNWFNAKLYLPKTN